MPYIMELSMSRPMNLKDPRFILATSTMFAESKVWLLMSLWRLSQLTVAINSSRLCQDVLRFQQSCGMGEWENKAIIRKPAPTEKTSGGGTHHGNQEKPSKDFAPGPLPVAYTQGPTSAGVIPPKAPPLPNRISLAEGINIYL